MARATNSNVTPDFVEGLDLTDPTSNETDWEWDTVKEAAPSKMIFDTIGDVFIGQYLGIEHVALELNAKGEDPSFDQYIFRGRDGERYSIAQSFDLQKAMNDVEESKWVRLEYVKDVATGTGKNDMKSFKVSVRK